MLFGVEITGEIFESSVDGDGDDGMSSTELPSDVDGSSNVESRRGSGEQTFLGSQTACHRTSVGLIDGAGLVVPL